MMRKAAKLSDIGFETLVETAKPGMGGIEIVAEMESTIRREGADLAKYWIASGPAPEWSDVKLEVKPHTYPYLRILIEGDLMVLCVLLFSFQWLLVPWAAHRGIERTV